MKVGFLRKRDIGIRSAAALLGLLVVCTGLSRAQEAWPGEDLLKGELPKQVLIEVLMADIVHAEDADLGVQYEFIDSGKGSVSLFNDASRVNPSVPEYYTRHQTGDLGSIIARFPLTERPDELFQGLDIVGQILDVDSGRLFAAIQALAEEGKGEILSRPSTVALDGQEARIKTGRIVPFLTRQITGTQETTVSDQKDTGSDRNISLHPRSSCIRYHFCFSPFRWIRQPSLRL